MDWFVIWRLFNAALAGIALTWCVLDYLKRDSVLTPRRRYLTWSLMMLLFACVWGSVEQIIQDAPFGFRTAIASAACVWTLVGLYVGRRDDEGWHLLAERSDA